MEGQNHRLVRRQRFVPGPDGERIPVEQATTPAVVATTARAAVTTPARAPAVTTTPVQPAVVTPSAAATVSQRVLTTNRAGRLQPSTVQTESLATTPSASVAPAAGSTPVTRVSTDIPVQNTPQIAPSRTPSSTSTAAASSSSSSSGGANGGAIAGGIIAAVVIIGAIVGFLFWRKKKAAKAAGSQNGGQGAWAKQKDEDEFFGSPSSQQQGQGSPFDAHAEKFGAGGEGAKYGAMAGAGAGAAVGAGAGWAAQQQHQHNNGGQRQPSWGNNSPSAFAAPHSQNQNQSPYPPVIPTSTTNLLHNQSNQSPYPQQQAGHSEIEAREMREHLDSQRSFTQQQEQQGGQLYNPSSPVHSSPPLSSANPSNPVALGAAGLAGAAAAVAGKEQQQEQSPFGADHPEQGEIRVVRRGFEPTLDDELSLTPGEHIQLLVKYDDDWALGINGAGRKGVFPFDCLGDAPTSSSPSAAAKPLTTIAEADSRPSSLAQPAAAQAQEKEELGYLSYDFPDSAPSPSTSNAPQLPTLRSDSPIDFSHPAPSQGGQGTPSIQISDPSGLSHSSQHAARASATGDYFSGVPGMPGLGAGEMDKGKGKRTSSLIASRDADLFVALGEVLDRDGGEGRK